MELQPEQQDSGQRTFMVMLLLMALLIVWTSMSRRPAPPQEPGTPDEQATRTTTADKPGTPVKPGTPAPKPGSAAPAKPDTGAPPVVGPARPERPPDAVKEQPLRRIVLRNRYFTAVFTNQDAALESLTLLDKFRDPPSAEMAGRAPKGSDLTEFGLQLLGQLGNRPSLVLAERPPAQGESSAATVDPPAPKLITPRRYELVSKEGDDNVVFRTTFADGQLEVTKTFALEPPSDDEKTPQRHVNVTIRIKNLGTTLFSFPGYRLRGGGGLAADIGPSSWKRGRVEPNDAEVKAAARTFGATIARRTKGKLNFDRWSCSSITKARKAAEDAAQKAAEAGAAAQRSAGNPNAQDAADEADQDARKKAHDYTTDYTSDGDIRWAAIQSNYFAAILEPHVGDGGGEVDWVYGAAARAAGEHNLHVSVHTREAVLQPGQAVVHTYRFYAGPKKPSDLALYEADFERVIASGWLDFLVAILAAILHTAHAVIPNYGVAIIILTIIVRIVLHPLSKKSQTSMAKMQKLQPQMTELREKYKSDKRRQQEEMTKLWRQYGVNPVGGCLPMILQLPVFIGLWRMLNRSVELRHAPFVFWIRDLAQPDSFLGHVNILPLIAVVVMFVQQRMMPKSPDPQQQQTQKIMGYMMPAMLGFFFYSLASGFALYFCASMFFGIVEQKFIRRHIDRMGDLKPVDRQPDKQSRRAMSTKQAKRKHKRKPF